MVPVNKTQAAKTVDDWLNSVNYKLINESYIATPFAYKFVHFIKNIVNDGRGDDNETPNVHLVMLDQLGASGTHFANLCHRGLAKTSVFAEYLFLYIAVFGEIDGFGEITGAMFVGDSMENGVATFRKNIENRYNNSQSLQKLVPFAHFTDKYIEFHNVSGHKFGIRMFGSKSGLRGNKIFNKRPTLAILDDLVSDEDARSPVSMDKIKDTVYSGINHSLDPRRKKVIFNGTPFNKADVLYEAVESGAWSVNVFPVCEKFPCERDEFHGSWEDRFTYDFLLNEYNLALGSGNLKSFNRELMLRITSEQERLVQDSEILWYDRAYIISNPDNYTFYVTTDFAVSDKKRADWSVICVWAYDHEGSWFLVDGYIGKSKMDVNIVELFRLIRLYNITSVGIETSGQQKGFVDWIRKEQLERNCFFPFAGENRDGIRPVSDKMSRFSLVLPLFKLGKIRFPRELAQSALMVELVEELSLASESGFKSKHDDVIDNISMLSHMNPVKPTPMGGTVFKRETNEWVFLGEDFDVYEGIFTRDVIGNFIV